MNSMNMGTWRTKKSVRNHVRKLIDFILSGLLVTFLFVASVVLSSIGALMFVLFLVNRALLFLLLVLQFIINDNK